MKETLQNAAMNFFTAKTEKRIMTGFYIFLAGYVLIQAGRFIIQNL